MKTVTVAGHAGVPSSNVAAVVLNLGAVNPSAHGYLETYPTGSGRPGGSPLTFPASGTLQGLAVVPVGTGGGVNVFSSAATDLTVDVIGWIPSHTTYTPVASRSIYNVGYSALTTNIYVAAQLGIAPSQLAAVQLTIATTSPSTGASLSVGPYSNAGFPTMLSFAAGQTVSNSATVAVNQTNGVISIRSTDHTSFVVYLSGYFRTAPTTAQVTAGNQFGCALSVAGTVKCWGANEHGQLGNGHASSTASPTPHLIPGLTGVASISAGATHACLVTTAGTVKCWGDDEFGQIGAGGTASSVVLPMPVTGISHVTQVAAGLAATCALTETGTVWCWGSNYVGQSGPAHVGTLVTRPQQVTGVTGAVQVTTGGIQSCALLASGTVKCWGDNYGGAVGGSNHSAIVGVTTVPGLSNAVEVSAGDHTTCAALANQTVKCWGGNDLAQLGNGHANTPAFVDTATTVPGLTGVTDVETHHNHVCAVTAAETLSCWGWNSSDQIGVPWSTANPVTRPRAVAGMSGVATVATGGGQTLAVLDSGAVMGWGDNSFGELAGSTRGFFPTPVDVLGL